MVQQRGREGGGAAGSSGAGGGAAAAAPLCTGPGRGMGRGGGEGARAPPLGVSSGGPGDGRPAPVARLRRALPAPSLHMPPGLPACAGCLRGERCIDSARGPSRGFLPSPPVRPSLAFANHLRCPGPRSRPRKGVGIKSDPALPSADCR